MAKNKTLTLGLVGRGTTSEKNAKALLDDFVASHNPDSVHVILAVTDDWHETHDAVLDWVETNEYSFDVVHDQAAKQDKDLKAIIGDAGNAVQVQQVARKVATDLEAADEPRALLVLWDPAVEEEEADPDMVAADPGYAAFEAAGERDVPVHDLTDGLERILWGDEEDEGPAAALEEPVTEAEEAAQAADEGLYPTRSELEDMDRADLKALAEKVGLELSGRAHTGTYVDELERHFKVQAVTVKENLSPEPAAQPAPAAEAAPTPAFNLQDLTDEVRLAVKEAIVDLPQDDEEVLKRVTATDKAISTLEKKVDELRGIVVSMQEVLYSVQSAVSTSHEGQPTPEAPRAAEDEEEEAERPKRRPRRARRG